MTTQEIDAKVERLSVPCLTTCTKSCDDKCATYRVINRLLTERKVVAAQAYGNDAA